MTRFVVDAGAVLHMAGEELEVAPEHELLAPTLLRSQVVWRIVAVADIGARGRS